jgi:hypothetical protein
VSHPLQAKKTPGYVQRCTVSAEDWHAHEPGKYVLRAFLFDCRTIVLCVDRWDAVHVRQRCIVIGALRALEIVPPAAAASTQLPCNKLNIASATSNPPTLEQLYLSSISAACIRNSVGTPIAGQVVGRVSQRQHFRFVIPADGAYQRKHMDGLFMYRLFLHDSNVAVAQSRIYHLQTAINRMHLLCTSRRYQCVSKQCGCANLKVYMKPPSSAD